MFFTNLQQQLKLEFILLPQSSRPWFLRFGFDGFSACLFIKTVEVLFVDFNFPNFFRKYSANKRHSRLFDKCGFKSRRAAGFARHSQFVLRDSVKNSHLNFRPADEVLPPISRDWFAKRTPVACREFVLGAYEYFAESERPVSLIKNQIKQM